jgi:dihydrodipicolinate synthase/N-acetylneuraminate lyase
MQVIEGVYVANVTPFREDPPYSLDVGAYLSHVDWLSEKGVRGIVPFGTNGEGPSVGLREKLQVLEALFEREPQIQVIPAMMEGNLPETLEMVHALEDYPATTVLVLPPYYQKPVTVEGLVRFYEPVLEASRHPIIVYHIPKYTVHIPEEVVIGLPVWGAKDSEGEPAYTESLLNGGKGVLLGTEDHLWQKLGLGAPEIISTLANFVPEEMLEMYETVRSGDEEQGRALSERLQQMRAMTKEYTSVSVLKKLAAARHGVSLGTVRPPLVPAPSDYAPEPVLELAEVV